jgi:hypothetical protein
MLWARTTAQHVDKILFAGLPPRSLASDSLPSSSFQVCSPTGIDSRYDLQSLVTSRLSRTLPTLWSLSICPAWFSFHLHCAYFQLASHSTCNRCFAGSQSLFHGIGLSLTGSLCHSHWGWLAPGSLLNSKKYSPNHSGRAVLVINVQIWFGFLTHGILTSLWLMLISNGLLPLQSGDHLFYCAEDF